MTTRFFHFRGLGATLTDLIGAPAANFTANAAVGPGATLDTLLGRAPPVGGTASSTPFARPPPTNYVLVNASAPSATLAIDPSKAAADAQKAAAAAEADRTAKALDDANAAFAAARAGHKGTRGGELMPVKLYQGLRDRVHLAEKRANNAQAMHESIDVGAKVGAALKWALLPAAAGAIVIGMAPPAGKKFGVMLVIGGVGLGVFRFFKKPGIDPSIDAEET